MKTIALLYHDVIENGRFRDSGFQGADADIYKLDLQEFRHHVSAIAEGWGGAPAKATELDPVRDWHLLLTLDDGGASAAGPVAALFAEVGWSAHFLVTTDYIGTPGFLSKDQIRALRAQGHVIGSHSCSHPSRMSSCSLEQLRQEWSQSCNVLSDVLEERIVVASVPGGFYSRRIAEAAGDAGIRVLFNSEPVVKPEVINGCMVIGRFGVQQGVSPEWVRSVTAREWMPRLKRSVHWNLKKVVKSVGGEHWLRLRRWYFAQRQAK
jgi:peptidoglycan/xylan/chitin deacetylase (PgdA/CDA1 family)